jgi:D-glycero-D-manno-heptose 1,7-bisphosphate phosphatase
LRLRQITNQKSAINHSLNHSIARPLPFLFRDLPAAGRRPAIFLDRDGVINERIIDGYVTNWHEFRFIAGAEQALRDFARLRVPILVVSNQSGVGRGQVTRSALEQITRRFAARVERRGARIDGVYYCPHRPDEGCACRKPKPGLLLQAAKDWRIDLAASVMIGDAATDVQAAQSAGCRSILIDSGPVSTAPGVISLAELRFEPIVVPDLAQVPQLVARLLGRSLY